MNDAPPLLRHRVIRDGRCLLARDEVERVNWEVATLREYFDTATWRELDKPGAKQPPKFDAEAYIASVRALGKRSAGAKSATSLGRVSPDAERRVRLGSEGLDSPSTNAETFDILGTWAKFRNVLVHLYLDIDHSVSYRSICHELGDLERFAELVETRVG